MLEYVKDRYPNCGIQRLPFCDSELDATNTSRVGWRFFHKVLAGKTKKGSLNLL